MLHSQAAFESSQLSSSTIPCPYYPRGVEVVPFNCSGGEAAMFVEDEAFSSDVRVSFGRIGVISKNASGTLDYSVNSVSAV